MAQKALQARETWLLLSREYTSWRGAVSLQRPPQPRPSQSGGGRRVEQSQALPRDFAEEKKAPAESSSRPVSDSVPAASPPPRGLPPFKFPAEQAYVFPSPCPATWDGPVGHRKCSNSSLRRHENERRHAPGLRLEQTALTRSEYLPRTLLHQG